MPTKKPVAKTKRKNNKPTKRRVQRERRNAFFESLDEEDFLRAAKVLGKASTELQRTSTAFHVTPEDIVILAFRLKKLQTPVRAIGTVRNLPPIAPSND